MNRGKENEMDLILLENLGELVFFDMDEFPDKNLSKFLGFFKEVPITPSYKYQDVKMKIYGIPSV